MLSESEQEVAVPPATWDEHLPPEMWQNLLLVSTALVLELFVLRASFVLSGHSFSLPGSLVAALFSATVPFLCWSH